MKIEPVKETTKLYQNDGEAQKRIDLQKAIQKDVVKEKDATTPLSNQKQAAQLLANAQPAEAEKDAARTKIDKDKGFDVKV